MDGERYRNQEVEIGLAELQDLVDDLDSLFKLQKVELGRKNNRTEDSI